MKKLVRVIVIVNVFSLFMGCGGSPQKDSKPPLSMSSLAQQNRFLVTVPTKDKNKYLVVQDIGNNNKEIQLWSKDLKHHIGTLFEVGAEYDIAALYAVPNNRFVTIVSGKKDPSNTARIISIDYLNNQVVFNTNVYNLSDNYKNYIQYNDGSNTLRLGNANIEINSLYNQNYINASDFTGSAHEWVYNEAALNSQSDSTSSSSYSGSDYSTGSPFVNDNGSYISNSFVSFIDYKTLVQDDGWGAKISVDTLRVGEQSATIDYREVNCGGYLIYLQEDNNGYAFDEVITYGNCGLEECQFWISTDGTKYEHYCNGTVYEGNLREQQ